MSEQVKRWGLAYDGIGLVKKEGGAYVLYEDHARVIPNPECWDRLIQERDDARAEVERLRAGKAKTVRSIVRPVPVFEGDEVSEENVRLREALERSEWMGHRHTPTGFSAGGKDCLACPVCLGVHPDDRHQDWDESDYGHRSDCPVGLALAGDGGPKGGEA